MAQPAKLEHVKFVKSNGATYAYFNTGKKKPNGQPLYMRMPDPSSPGFWDSYAAFRGARKKMGAVEYTIANLARDYEYSPAFAALAKGSQGLYSKTLRKIVKLIGKVPMEALDRKKLRAVLDKEMMGPGAHNIFLATIGAMFKWARDGERTELEPTKGIARLKTGEHEPWPEHVLVAGLNAEDDLIRLLVQLHYFTGQRVGDVCAMRWTDIEDGVLHVIQQKGGKEVWIPVIAELQAVLDATPMRGLFIALDENERPFTPESVLKKIKPFTAALGHKRVTHGLRKNAVNAFLEAGCSVPQVASITGQTYAIVEHYAKRVNQKNMAKAAVVKLENRRGAKKEKANG